MALTTRTVATGRQWSVFFLIFVLTLVIPLAPAAENQDPWDFLSDFRHVEGAIRRIDDHHVAAIFYHSGKQLSALVIFPSNCEGQRCSLANPVAYSVFNDKGLVIRSHENSGQRSLLQKILTSASAVFTAA